MSQNRSNMTRLFSEVVSLRAWRTPFDGETGVADIFADIVFGEGRIGAQRDSSVRFKLSLKRAELHLVIPKTEPLKLDPSSVTSTGPKTAIRKEVVEKEASAGADAKLDASGVSGGVDAAGKVRYSQRTESEEVVFSMMLKDRPLHDGHCWMFDPDGARELLDGRPWPQQDKLAKLRQTAESRIDPSARFEVKCRREDLHFSDIVLKDEQLGMWEKLTRNRQESVIAYLRDEMARAGLVFEDFEDPYGVLVLADDIIDEN